MKFETLLFYNCNTVLKDLVLDPVTRRLAIYCTSRYEPVPLVLNNLWLPVLKLCRPPSDYFVSSEKAWV